MNEKDINQILDKMEEHRKLRMEKYVEYKKKRDEYKKKRDNSFVVQIFGILIAVCGAGILLIALLNAQIFGKILNLVTVKYPEAVVTVGLLVLIGGILLLIYLGGRLLQMGFSAFLRGAKDEEELDKEHKGESHT